MSKAKTERPVIPGRRQGPLPEAGYAREEELKRRLDDLNELKAMLEGELEKDGVVEVGPQKIRLDQMKIENEIASKFDFLVVPEALEDMRYCWVNYVNQHALAVKTKQVEGWEIVCGDMPECPNLRDELGRRRIGDVILMRIPIDRYVQIQYRNQLVKENKRLAVERKFTELNEKTAQHGIRVRADMTEREQRHALANDIARQKVDSMLRSGSIPGMHVGK